MIKDIDKDKITVNNLNIQFEIRKELDITCDNCGSTIYSLVGDGNDTYECSECYTKVQNEEILESFIEYINTETENFEAYNQNTSGITVKHDKGSILMWGTGVCDLLGLDNYDEADEILSQFVDEIDADLVTEPTCVTTNSSYTYEFEDDGSRLLFDNIYRQHIETDNELEIRYDSDKKAIAGLLVENQFNSKSMLVYANGKVVINGKGGLEDTYDALNKFKEFINNAENCVY